MATPPSSALRRVLVGGDHILSLSVVGIYFWNICIHIWYHLGGVLFRQGTELWQLIFGTRASRYQVLLRGSQGNLERMGRVKCRREISGAARLLCRSANSKHRHELEVWNWIFMQLH